MAARSARQTLAAARTLPASSDAVAARPRTQAARAALEARPETASHDVPAAATTQAPGSGVVPIAFAAVTIAAIVWGFFERHEKHVVPETGLGYWLGIVGGLMMLSMLLYQKRKRMRGGRAIGSVKLWFQAHMILGVLGPVLILFHSNFQLNSTNSTIAMAAMTTVVLSGIVGRYIYAKIHSGLYGQRAELSALMREARDLKRAFGLPLANAPGIMAELQDFEAEVLASAGSGRRSLRAILTLRREIRSSLLLLQSETQALLTAKALREGWDARTLNRHRENAARGLEAYFAIVRKAAGLRFYERLFSLWHMLHLPLFFLLIIATVVHIVAVHIY